MRSYGLVVFIAVRSSADSCRVAAILLTTWTYDGDIFSGVFTYVGDLFCTLVFCAAQNQLGRTGFNKMGLSA